MIDVFILSESSESHNIARTASVVPAGTEPFAEIEAPRGTGLIFTARTTSKDPAGMEPFVEWTLTSMDKNFEHP